MKFRLWEIIVFTLLIVFGITFSLLTKVWSGFNYFSVSIFFLIIIFYILNRLFYLRDLKLEYESGLRLYFAELLNNGLISREQFDDYDPKILKGYFKPYRKSKRIQICIVIAISLSLLTVSLFLFGVW